MKKFLFITLFSVISIFSFTDFVSADTTINLLDTDIIVSGERYYTNLDSLTSEQKEKLHTLFNNLMEEYNSNYKNDFPFYRFELYILDKNNSNFPNAGGVEYIYLSIHIYNTIDFSSPNFSQLRLSNSYTVSNSTFETISVDNTGNGYVYLNNSFYGVSSDNNYYYYPLYNFYSNFDLKLPSTFSFYNVTSSSNVTDTYTFNLSNNRVIAPNDIIPPYYENDFPFLDNYNTIDLSNYDYIALIPKSYNSSFTSDLYIKGQLCITPMYDFGTKYKQDNTNTCSLNYSDFTSNKLYVLDSDIRHNAIFYLSTYNDVHTEIKYDTSKFDVQPFDSTNSEHPVINVNGVRYNSLNLKDNPNSTNANESSGLYSNSCQVGDLNCTKELTTNKTTDFTSVFSQPLKFFKDLFNSISIFFGFVWSLFSVFPPFFQTAIYFGFSVAIVVAIIKILL